MKTLLPIVLAVFIATGVSACGGTLPKPVVPDGSHRIPVNQTPSVAPVEGAVS